GLDEVGRVDLEQGTSAFHAIPGLREESKDVPGIRRENRGRAVLVEGNTARCTLLESEVARIDGQDCDVFQLWLTELHRVRDILSICCGRRGGRGRRTGVPTAGRAKPGDQHERWPEREADGDLHIPFPFQTPGSQRIDVEYPAASSRPWNTPAAVPRVA